MPKIDERYKKNINRYADSIKTITNFATAIRKTPGQYIGYIGNPGYINMIREIFQNGMDELQKSDSPCTTVWITYYETDNTIIVQDNGRGIPFGHMERVYASEHTSSNYIKKAREFSAGRHGVGAKVTNALSHQFEATSYMCKEVTPNGKPQAHQILFTEGQVWDKGDKKTHELEVKNPNNFQGTIVKFSPSTQIMGPITCTVEDVLELVSMLLPLMKIDAIVDFKGFKKNGKIIDRHIVNEDGILSFLIASTKSPVIKPIIISDICDTMKCDIAFTYDTANIGDETILSFANTCPTVNTINSTHVKGFLDSLTAYFRTYMNNVFLGSKSKVQVSSVDIRSGLNAVVSVSHLEPIFSGQAKEIFSNKDIIPFIKDAMYRTFDEWIKQNPADLQKLCKFYKDMAELRTKQDKDKANYIVKNRSSIDGLPSKYEKPLGKEHLELIIVEGDSAMGPCRDARDPERQGIFPIRGKIINAMTKSRAEFFDNEEAKGIRAILDAGDGKTFDIDKCKFEKVIFMGDADVDGWHIRQLLLKAFLVYFRPLIDAGKVYAAEPPLYSVRINGKNHYFTQKKDYIDFVLKGFARDNVVLTPSKKKIPIAELKELLYTNSDFLEEIKRVRSTYAVDPLLLEKILTIKDESLSKIKKDMKSFGRYMDVKMVHGTLVFEGLYGDKINTVIYNEFMENKCKRLIGFINGSPEKYFILNGQKVTLLQLMNAYTAYQPSKIQRYKGLGEMNDYDLMESTLHPDYDRNLIQFTSEDIKKDIAAIREINSNKALLLKGLDFAGYEL